MLYLLSTPVKIQEYKIIAIVHCFVDRHSAPGVFKYPPEAFLTCQECFISQLSFGDVPIYTPVADNLLL